MLLVCTWVWGHPPEHGHHTSGHTCEEKWLSFLQQLSIGHSFSARDGISQALPYVCQHADWLVFYRYPSLLWVCVWWPCHIQKTLFPSTPSHPPILTFFQPPVWWRFLSLVVGLLVSHLSFQAQAIVPPEHPPDFPPLVSLSLMKHEAALPSPTTSYWNDLFAGLFPFL